MDFTFPASLQILPAPCPRDVLESLVSWPPPQGKLVARQQGDVFCTFTAAAVFSSCSCTKTCFGISNCYKILEWPPLKNQLDSFRGVNDLFTDSLDCKVTLATLSEQVSLGYEPNTRKFACGSSIERCPFSEDKTGLKRLKFACDL